MKKAKSIALKILKALPLLLCIAFMLIYLFSGEEISFEQIVNFAPEKPPLAALFIIVLYALKSISVFFPIVVLNIASGFLFDTPIALLVSTIGIVIELTVPYFVGRASGSDFVERLCEKYPKLKEFINVQNNRGFFIIFFLHVISCLPCDVLSMYFGALKTPYFKHVAASYLGLLPGMFAAILLGENITDPTSPQFWFSVIFKTVISFASALLYFIWQKRRKKQTQV